MLKMCLPLMALMVLPLQSVLEVDVNLVNVFVSVQDAQGRFISGLQSENFRISEDGREREIEIFEPTASISSSLGILIDNSGSSASSLRSIKSGVEEFASSLGPEDETFIMSFAIRTDVLYDFNQRTDQLPRALARLRSWGTSVLFDALSEAISKVGQGANERKALVVLSDGGDNGSVFDYRDVVKRAQSDVVLLYFVGIGPPILIDTYTIEGLASISGGRVVLVEGGKSVSDALAQIRQELSYQYYLGYHASSEPGFHSIRVEIPGQNVTVRARDGYLVQ
jgi:Ca-activated chloride channel family protein